MKLHIHFEKVQEPRSWLFRTVHNLAMNHHRAHRKVVSIEQEVEKSEANDLADTEPLPDEYISRMEAIGQTRLCLESLDERSRMLVRLKFEEDLSYREMSQRTGLSISNVGYILHHTLKQMASDLEKTGVSL